MAIIKSKETNSPINPSLEQEHKTLTIFKNGKRKLENCFLRHQKTRRSIGLKEVLYLTKKTGLVVLDNDVDKI